TLYGIARVGAGDQVLLTGVLREPSRFEQFDYRTFLADEGIIAVLDSPRLVQSAPGSPDPLHAAIFAIRHALIDAVDRTLPEPDAALVLGVVFGYRAALPTALDQAMIQSGLIHIVVISGLKVSLLARLVQRALGRVWPRAAPIVALTAMVAYALVAGASAAALRAAAMGALVVIAGVVRRESQVYVSLALTAALMLGLKPALAHDVSFQLSFAGTLGIATMTDPIAARLRMMPGVLRDPFSATCAAEIATWPLMLANFHQVSVVGPVANALVLPLLPAIIVLGGLGALVAILVQPVGSTLLQGAGLIATWFQVVITWTAGLPGAAITAPYFPVRWLLAAGVLNGGALAALKLRVFLWQRRVWAGAGGLALIATVLLLVRPDGRLHVYALDVGSGSAVLVRTPSGEQVLIDAGPDPNLVAQALGRALPPTARRLTAWIVTGGRLDEIGGAQAILDRFQVDRVIIAEVKPWSVTLRALVDRAQTLGITVQTTIAAVGVDGVVLEPMPDERTWLVWQGGAALAIVPPDTDWVRLPRGVEGAVFTQGGPAEWGPSDGRGVAVVQVAAHSRAGLPARAFLRGLGPGPVLRTDRLGTVELVAGSAGFQPAG
ncbi:MAG TPA: ComEC/Rec2 family competence protein, partial [Candidatus Limnocylindrales bacterium]|nr:ComEC/Rec2 family competence protein [Candidatus Limnocylindrales bacterium]